MSCRVYIADRIVMTVGIQVQSIAIVGVFLQEAAYYGVVEACAQVVEVRYGIVLLACEAEAVLHGLFPEREVTEGIIFIAVQYVSVCIRYVGDAPQLVGSIMVVGSRAFAVGAYKLISPDMADGAAVRSFEDCLVTVIYESDEPAVLLELCTQSFAVILAFRVSLGSSAHLLRRTYKSVHLAKIGQFCMRKHCPIYVTVQ